MLSGPADGLTGKAQSQLNVCSVRVLCCYLATLMILPAATTVARGHINDEASMKPQAMSRYRTCVFVMSSELRFPMFASVHS